VLACMVAGLLVAALGWVSGVLPPGGDGMTTTVLRAYRSAVDPTPVQDVVLRSDCGAQRFAFNWGPALIQVRLHQRATRKPPPGLPPAS
jgi:putative transposase